ncbi:MAG: SAM-dependent methyltransferase, partial [Pseudonocardia sp.]|nr:SAM-dependent methyltransferase [Pseudonocardia sp.]
VRFLAGEVGISQFLDIGTGLPTMQNTHEVAQGIIPNSRIVYVDNDPIVLTYARALLTNTTSEGITTYINANLHDPEQIITAARNVLNFSQPVAVIISDILGHIADYDEARSIVSTLVEAVPSGSYLAVQDGTNTSTGAREAAARYAKTGALPYIMRPPGQVAGYLHGLERVEPGVVTVTGWRPQANHVARPRPTDQYGGVARKP